MDAREPVDQGAPEVKAKASRARKAKSPKAIEGTGKRSLNLRVDESSYMKLSIHALMTGQTISDLVMGFAQSLREYSMPHRIGGRTGEPE